MLLEVFGELRDKYAHGEPITIEEFVLDIIDSFGQDAVRAVQHWETIETALSRKQKQYQTRIMVNTGSLKANLLEDR